MTKLFEKYDNILTISNCLTESDLIALKSRISGNQASLTDDEVINLRDRLNHGECEYNITQEHSDKGMEYLLRKCFKVNGQRRNTTQLDNMPDMFFLAIKDFNYFTFGGFECLDFNPYNNRMFYMPVWRIHTNSGETFDYCMDSGLNFLYIGSSDFKNRLSLIG